MDFPSHILTFLAPSPLSFSSLRSYMAEKKCLHINHSGFVPVFINQIIWCHTHLCSLGSVYRERRGGGQKAPCSNPTAGREKKKNKEEKNSLHLAIISSNTTPMIIAILSRRCFHYKNVMNVKHNVPRATCRLLNVSGSEDDVSHQRCWRGSRYSGPHAAVASLDSRKGRLSCGSLLCNVKIWEAKSWRFGLEYCLLSVSQAPLY